MSKLVQQFPNAAHSLDSTLVWFIPALAGGVILVLINWGFHSTIEKLGAAILREATNLRDIKDPGTINLITTFFLFILILGAEFIGVFLLFGKAIVTRWHIAEAPLYQTLAAVVVVAIYSLICLRTVERL